MDLTKYNDTGMTGIENMGNTCFLNVCMQILSHTYELNDFLDSPKFQKHIKNNDDGIISNEWNDLRKVMWSANGVVTPTRFVNNIMVVAKRKNRDLFTGFSQNDMPEFLMFIVDCIHNSVCRSVEMTIKGQIENNTDKNAMECNKMLKQVYNKEYSEVYDMFYGISFTEIVSKDCEIQHVFRPESYFMINLQLLNGNTVMTDLYECLDFYTQPELLEGDNAWYNEKTKAKEDVLKRTQFWNFPNILAFNFNRYTPDGRTKINAPVNYPINDLNLSKYVRGYKKETFQYELYGVVNHFGNARGGHYTVFIKHSHKKWVHFNDERVEMIKDDKTILSQHAYSLFYRKKNNLI